MYFAMIDLDSYEETETGKILIFNSRILVSYDGEIYDYTTQTRETVNEQQGYSYFNKVKRNSKRTARI